MPIAVASQAALEYDEWSGPLRKYRIAMNDKLANLAQTDPKPKFEPYRAVRHGWFPLAVLLAVIAWLVFQSSKAGYQTFYHVAAVLIGALTISIWFALFGPWSHRLRWSIAGSLWVAMALTWLAFKPIYNGDMGIVGLRLRFSSDADELLPGIRANHPADDWQSTPRDYPRFLGDGYWAEVADAKLDTDWESRPPQEIWRRPIGAGWSAFAIVGPYAVTQEQRGQDELVTCYRVADGSPVWAHDDPVRFDPGATGGLGRAGPRATPTIVGDRVLTQGATGLVNCLDARSGEILWSRDTIAESGAELPLWGKSGSPLVVDGLVIISVGAPAEASRPKGKKIKTSLAAYDLNTGRRRWSVGDRQASYASPIVATFAGEKQIICLNEGYVTAHRVKNGAVLWETPWPSEHDTTASASQPVPVGGDRLFLSKGYVWGASLFKIKRDPAGEWIAFPLWDPPLRPVMKTKFNNVVLHDGFVYGLDDVLMQCIELKTGQVKWKKRRSPEFGHGQVLLVGDVILVLSESGELAMVEASPKKYHELGSIQVLDPVDVTWNNPAFAPPFLLVRNAREAACYRLPLREKQIDQ
jgi:outer membrane protein assembly factor BamB